MNKWWIPALTALALLNGCATQTRSNIPVVDSGSRVSNSERVSANRNNTYRAPVQQNQAPQALDQDSGVTVMVPGGAGAAPISTFVPPTSAPISTSPVGASSGSQAPINNTYTPPAATTNTYTMPSSAPTGIPSASSGGLSADEQLDGPVLALLTTAQQQQSSGDLNGASSSLERAQRVAPREPQVLYRLAQVRLAQGDAPQAEQLARRALTLSNGRADLQASLWGLIAQAREKQGDAAGAALARQKANG
ncbi:MULTISPECIES: tetratricopeptide repeat protein [unclassified Pseudomonas]|uniref:tetratricopeptide repeat protein n=1 Tax=unclassified Pseudomonas TaxID=196821 RepID=UPI003850BFBD